MDLGRVPHCDGRGLDRRVIVVTAAQERNEARPRVLRAERDVAVARERRLDALTPSARRDGDALVGIVVAPIPATFITFQIGPLEPSERPYRTVSRCR